MPLTHMLGAVQIAIDSPVGDTPHPLTHLLGAVQIGDMAAGGWAYFAKCPVISPHQPCPSILSAPRR